VAVANQGSQTQTRHGGGADWAGQGGLERIAAGRAAEDGARVAEEAIALLDAPECPTGTGPGAAPEPDGLQIHESIGHPLELDRILGDERNYAGTSFVTPEMFGSYRYGSALLNVTFDPTVPGELASYAPTTRAPRPSGPT
jgi:predicted Zn-dependent protease